MANDENANQEKHPQKRKRGKSRRRGSGSVFRRPERKGGKEWIAQILLENGKTKQTYHSTQAEAEEALNEMQYEQRRGMLVTGPRETVEHYLEYWLEEVHKPRVRESSYVRYHSIMRLHILPALGHLQLQELTPRHIQTLYAQKAKEQYSTSTIRGIHAVLHLALDNAVRLGSLSRNVSDNMPIPRLAEREITPLTIEQTQLLLASIQGHRLEALLVLALFTGMRLGEVAGLKWADINFTEGALQVRQILTYVPGKGLVESKPKTAQSRRRITLPDFVVHSLKQHRVRQLAEKLKAGASWQEHGLVFCTARGTYLNPASTIHDTFKRILKRADLPRIRFHDLRHGAATILLSMGINPKVVQEILGHSTITMTLNVYAHVLPGMQQEAMEKLNALLGKQADKDDEEQETGI